MSIRVSNGVGLITAVLSCALALPGRAQEAAGPTALTIYSTARPGAVPPELYRPVAGQEAYMPGQAVPGYAMIRQQRSVDLKQGPNRLDFRDVAAYIDPTTVTFESLTAPVVTTRGSRIKRPASPGGPTTTLSSVKAPTRTTASST